MYQCFLSTHNSVASCAGQQRRKAQNASNLKTPPQQKITKQNSAIAAVTILAAPALVNLLNEPSAVAALSCSRIVLWRQRSDAKNIGQQPHLPLKLACEKPPVVMVAASVAGFYASQRVDQYPAEVAGGHAVMIDRPDVVIHGTDQISA